MRTFIVLSIIACLVALALSETSTEDPTSSTADAGMTSTVGSSNTNETSTESDNSVSGLQGSYLLGLLGSIMAVLFLN